MGRGVWFVCWDGCMRACDVLGWVGAYVSVLVSVFSRGRYVVPELFAFSVSCFRRSDEPVVWGGC